MTLRFGVDQRSPSPTARASGDIDSATLDRALGAMPTR